MIDIIKKLWLKKKLNNLSVAEKQIIDNYFIKGYSIREVSIILSMPKSTIYYKIKKIINKLRKEK